MDNKKKEMIDRLITIGILILCIVMVAFNYYNKNFLGVLLMSINTYMLIKYRKHKLLFFSMMVIWYFNYSFVITRYIGINSALLDNLFRELINSDTIYLSIIMQIVFLCIINLIIGNVEDIKKSEKIVLNFEYRKIFVFVLQFVLIAILIYHLVNGITYNTTLFEYSILLFILTFHYSKGNKRNKIITEIILVMFSIYSILCGERIAVLQFLIVDFVINYIDKFKIKHIILCMVLGIFAFTLAGLYGDFLDYGHDFKDLTPKFVIEKFEERRLALDTSVSAYFSGVSMVDVSDKYSDEFRLNNALEYFTKYTFLGSKADYKTLDIIVREYQVNYGGGFPTCYFYFWFNWIGVILISVYVGILFRIVKNSTKTTSSSYTKLLSIFIVSTIPRWYLYIPTMLFRGIIIFSILYVIMHFIVMKIIEYVIDAKTKNKEKPLVSVIMATKDTEEGMLRAAIDSILSQTYRNFEFIIVCDGSDRDFEIIKSYNDKRIVLIKHAESKGLTISLNECLKIAKGKYIARMDSDDVARCERLKIEVDFLEKNEKIAICSTFAKYIGDRNSLLIDIFNKPKEKKAELFIYNNIVHSSVMMKKSFLTSNNLKYDENYRYSQDYELWTRCCNLTDINVIPKVCMEYRVHKTQISTAKRSEQNELCRNIFKRQMEQLHIDDIDRKVDIIFYLSKKSENDYNNKDILNFIEEVLANNSIYNVYDQKALKRVLYYRYFVMKYKELNMNENMAVLFKINAFELVIKKIFYSIKEIFC